MTAKPIRVVIAEDEELAREKLARWVNAERDLELVGEAIDGPGALEMVRVNDPDLLFLDVRMPGISGLELLQEAKRRWPLLPLVIVTAYGDPESRQKAYEAGALDFVTKPIDFDALKSKITNILTLTGG